MADNRNISIAEDIAMHKLRIAHANTLPGPRIRWRLSSVQKSQHGPPRRDIFGLPVGGFQPRGPRQASW